MTWDLKAQANDQSVTEKHRGEKRLIDRVEEREAKESSKVWC